MGEQPRFLDHCFEATKVVFASKIPNERHIFLQEMAEGKSDRGELQDESRGKFVHAQKTLQWFYWGGECRIRVYNGRIHIVPLDNPS